MPELPFARIMWKILPDFASGTEQWVALALCFFLGFAGAHKFYEQKVVMGVLYILTMGVFGIGVIIDIITILFKPTIYYV